MKRGEVEEVKGRVLREQLDTREDNEKPNLKKKVVARRRRN
ncbi:MAG: hypothetical protein ABJN34_02960 [Litoreibacter sp.]